MATRLAALLILFLFIEIDVYGQSGIVSVADEVSGEPIEEALVYDKQGKLVGYTSKEGALPALAHSAYPLTVRCIGYETCVISTPSVRKVLMRRKNYELPEVVVNSKDKQVLHLLGYVREYSTLATYTDTVFLFREKTVDFMLPSKRVKHFKGWRSPRVLSSKSYYRFTGADGLDSVSDNCNTHFSWSDWVDIPAGVHLNRKCKRPGTVVDTVPGHRSASQIWKRDSDKVSISINVLADTLNRQWVNRLKRYHMGVTDFYRMDLKYEFEDVDEDTILPEQLHKFAFQIESDGRGFRLPHLAGVEREAYVETKAEVYIIDKTYMSEADARKWEKKAPNYAEVGILIPEEAALYPADVSNMVERVGRVDKDLIRRRVIPDKRLAGIDDLFKTRLSPLEQILYLISPPRVQVNTNIYSGAR